LQFELISTNLLHPFILGIGAILTLEDNLKAMMQGLDAQFANATTVLGDSQRHIETARKADLRRQAENSGRFDAEGIFKHLLRRVDEFQAGLSGEEEVGLQLANFGLAAQIHVRSIGYVNPNIVEFTGLDANGNKSTLIQHISQLSFMLIALKPFKETPYRVGFVNFEQA
jgi:hypothetical protein